MMPASVMITVMMKIEVRLSMAQEVGLNSFITRSNCEREPTASVGPQINSMG